MARVVIADTAGIAEAAARLAAGEVIGLPTETVYGLAGRATDARAIAKIFAAKDRPLFDPLIVHLSQDALETVVDWSAFSPRGRDAVRTLTALGWPGPLTVVLPRTDAVPDLATAGLPTVAVRVPSHPVARAVIAAVGPLVAPSANRFGRISPTTAAHVVEELGDRVDLVLDGGPCAIGVESTIVEVQPDGSWVLLRPGGLAVEAVIARLGAPVADRGGLRAPGGLPSHYAPGTPVRIGVFSSFGPGIAALAFSAERAEVARAHGLGPIALPSPDGDPAQVAAGLFAALRQLDATRATAIAVEPVSVRTGLWHAIADRLQRAATRS